MTSHHGIPHGHAVSLTMAPMLRYNQNITAEECNHPDGAAFIKCELVPSAIALADSLMQ